MEFNLNHLPDDVIHAFGFCGEDGAVVKLNAVSQAGTVL
jgi:hypothetical protein